MANELLSHLIKITKSLAASTSIGSAFVTALNEYLPSAHDEALRKGAEALNERVNTLGNRLDLDFIRTDQFADLFKNCYLICQRTQHTEKLRAAASILTNALLCNADGDKLPYEELDHFTRCVESLSIGAIHVLGDAIKLAERQDHGRKPPRIVGENVRVDFGELHSQTPRTNHDLLMGLVGELTSMHLLHSLGSPTVRTERYSNYPIETTPLGYRFVRYVLRLDDPKS